ncbi:FmdB family zinc ribbon protein [Granulicoccus sp. GXG6511]|uniref:FmdB family zinc ribbon protein n=1 Tax=Granulicoccus sp. GXG6511 TaxID=3381351 RepID=UPI003D7CB5FA
MPTYQYRCKDCGADLEVVQKFTDDALTDCPSCEGGELRKIFNAVGVVFKGSGFYRTDSRAGSADSKSTAGSGSSSAEKASGGADSKSSGSAAPATAGSAN